jgi:hypothetical protein
MRRKRKLDRRSFLAQVLGGTVGGSALLVTGVGACATASEPRGERRMIVDADPADPAREPPEPAAVPGTSSVSDSDSGTNADPIGHGQSARRRSGITDSDSGANADPAGHGRSARRRSGITDSDSGANADPAGLGRAQASPAPRESFIICPGNPRCPQ